MDSAHAPAMPHIPWPSLLPGCSPSTPWGCQVPSHSPARLRGGCAAASSELALTYCPTSLGVRRRGAGRHWPSGPGSGADGPICSTRLLPGALAARGDGAWGTICFLGQSQLRRRDEGLCWMSAPGQQGSFLPQSALGRRGCLCSPALALHPAPRLLGRAPWCPPAPRQGRPLGTEALPCCPLWGNPLPSPAEGPREMKL